MSGEQDKDALATLDYKIGIVISDLVETQRTGEAKHDLYLLTDEVRASPIPEELREWIVNRVGEARNHLVQKASLGIDEAIDVLSAIARRLNTHRPR